MAISDHEDRQVRDDRSDTQGYAAIAGFGEKLRRLRETLSQERGRKVTQQEVADFVAQRTRRPCDRAYISALEKGDKPAPMADKLAALAEFFNVPAGYFFNDEQSHLINALAAEEARLAALRLLATLSPEELDKVTAAIEQTRSRPPEPRSGGPRPGVYEP